MVEVDRLTVHHVRTRLAERGEAAHPVRRVLPPARQRVVALRRHDPLERRLAHKRALGLEDVERLAHRLLEPERVLRGRAGLDPEQLLDRLLRLEGDVRLVVFRPAAVERNALHRRAASVEADRARHHHDVRAVLARLHAGAPPLVGMHRALDWRRPDVQRREITGRGVFQQRERHRQPMLLEDSELALSAEVNGNASVLDPAVGRIAVQEDAGQERLERLGIALHPVADGKRDLLERLGAMPHPATHHALKTVARRRADVGDRESRHVADPFLDPAVLPAESDFRREKPDVSGSAFPLRRRPDDEDQLAVLFLERTDASRRAPRQRYAVLQFRVAVRGRIDDCIAVCGMDHRRQEIRILRVADRGVQTLKDDVFDCDVLLGVAGGTEEFEQHVFLLLGKREVRGEATHCRIGLHLAQFLRSQPDLRIAGMVRARYVVEAQPIVARRQNGNDLRDGRILPRLQEHGVPAHGIFLRHPHAIGLGDAGKPFELPPRTGKTLAVPVPAPLMLRRQTFKRTVPNEIRPRKNLRRYDRNRSKVNCLEFK